VSAWNWFVESMTAKNTPTWALILVMVGWFLVGWLEGRKWLRRALRNRLFRMIDHTEDPAFLKPVLKLIGELDDTK
jgi:hypothetical protein